MANQPKTPTRSVRIPDDEWDAIRSAAAARGVTASDVIRAAVRKDLEGTE
jgi:Arc/MetJ-type ribon-helix-helix transcriptional regulator